TGEGWINGILSMVTGSLDAGMTLGQSVLGAFTGAGRWLYQTGRDMARGLLNGFSSIGGKTIGTRLAKEVNSGVKGSGGLYSTGRSMAQDLREGLYSYNNSGTGRRVGNIVASGMRKGSAHSA